MKSSVILRRACEPDLLSRCQFVSILTEGLGICLQDGFQKIPIIYFFFSLPKSPCCACAVILIDNLLATLIMVVFYDFLDIGACEAIMKKKTAENFEEFLAIEQGNLP